VYSHELAKRFVKRCPSVAELLNTEHHYQRILCTLNILTVCRMEPPGARICAHWQSGHTWVPNAPLTYLLAGRCM